MLKRRAVTVGIVYVSAIMTICQPLLAAARQDGAATPVRPYAVSRPRNMLSDDPRAARKPILGGAALIALLALLGSIGVAVGTAGGDPDDNPASP